MSPSSTHSAGSRVAGITELLESILIHLTAKDLFLAQRTSQQFTAVINASSVLQPIFQQRALREHYQEDHLLPIIPSLFQRAIARRNATKATQAPSWYLEFAIDTEQLGYGTPGPAQSWRKMLICGESTRHVLGVLTVDHAQDPGGPRNGMDVDDIDNEEYEEDGEYWTQLHGDFMDPSGYEAEEAFTSQSGITLGDLADWACTLRDRPQRPRSCRYGIVFMATVDAEGCSRKITPSS